MRINGGNPLQYVADLYKKNRMDRADQAKSGSVSDVSSDSADKADKVEISDQARLLSLAREAFAQTPDIREEKVSQLREKIESKEYEVDSRELAKRLISEIDLTEGLDDQ